MLLFPDGNKEILAQSLMAPSVGDWQNYWLKLVSLRLDDWMKILIITSNLSILLPELLK